MNYIGLYTDHHVALLHDWLTELGELFVRLEYPHSASSGDDFWVRSLEDLRDLMSRQTRCELEIFIFRAIIFPIRGTDYSALLQRALQEIPEGQYYQIVVLPPHTRESKYAVSHQCECLAAGQGHDELRGDIANLEPGREIAIGVHPFDTSYEEFERFYGRPVEQLSFEARLKISNNLDRYDEFSKNPAKYQDVVRRWKDDNDVEYIIVLIRTCPDWAEVEPGDQISKDQILGSLINISNYDWRLIRRAIVKLINDHPSDTSLWNRFFLLNRFLFDVPEKREHNNQLFGGLAGVPIENGVINWLWPFSYDANGDIQLAGEFEGYSRDPYQAVQEFDFFQDTFGFKKRWIRRWFNQECH
jgi:hypothetical protein